MSKRTREERESIATPQKIDIKRRKSEEDVSETVETAETEIQPESTPTKPVTGIKWIPSADDVADAVTEAAAETKVIAEETEAVAKEIKEEAKKDEDEAEDKATEEDKKEEKEEEVKADEKEESKPEAEKAEKADETTKADTTASEKAETTEKTDTEKTDTEKTDNKTSETSETSATPSNGDTKPKHVFGSNSKFSGGFGAFKNSGSSFGGWGKSSTTPSTTPASSAPAAASTGSSYVFGSSTKYSGGFSSVLNNMKKDDTTKSDNPWASKKGKTEEKTDEDKDDKDKEDKEQESEKEKELEKEKEAEHYIGVSAPLAKKESMETGEEGEESVYTCRAKLYYFDLTNSTEGWKERGVGQVHINKLKPEDVTETCSGRIVMRTDAVHRVVLNMGLVKGLEVQAGMGASLSSDKVIRISTIEDDKPVQYALKCGNPDAAKQLLAGIKGLIPV